MSLINIPFELTGIQRLANEAGNAVVTLVQALPKNQYGEKLATSFLKDQEQQMHKYFDRERRAGH